MSVLASDVPSKSAVTDECLLISTVTRDHFSDWDELVSKSSHGTIFHYSWWLDATDYDFKILGCWNEKGKLVAGIPLPWKKKAGLLLYHSPRLTPYLGPIFDLSDIPGVSKQLSLIRKCGEILAQSIQGFDSLDYIAGAAAPDFQGFLWAGFRAELLYTFRFDAGMTSDTVLQEVRRTHRQKLRKQAQYILETGDDIHISAELVKQTFERQGMTCPFNEDYVRGLWEAASKRGKGTVYIARDMSGRPVSSLVVVHDDRTSYQIISGMDMTLRDSAAGYLTTWQAICDALAAGRAYDFEGSRVRGVEQYYRLWGAAARPVWRLRKEGSMRGWFATTVFDGVLGRKLRSCFARRN